MAHLGRLAGQDLVDQVVDDESVAAGERLDEVGDLGVARDGPQGQRGELKAGDPAFGALLEGIDLCGIEVQAHPLVQELLRLSGGEAQVGAADFDDLSAAAQSREGQRRIGAGGHHQVQLVRCVVEKEGHCRMHLGCGDDVVVVHDEDPLRAR